MTDGNIMRKLLFAFIALLALQAGVAAISAAPAYADCCNKSKDGG
jgi:hypothetical protein